MFRARHCLLAHPCLRASTATSFKQRDFSSLVTIDWQSAYEKGRFRVRHRFQDQCVRFRRHDRASAFSKPRPKTKKQRQVYNRRMKRLDEERATHNPPGSKAGPRRQEIKERWQQLFELSDNTGKELLANGDDDEEEYGMEDALMEDILGNTAHLTSQPTPEPVHLGHMHKKYYNAVADQMDRYREYIDAKAASTADSSNATALLDLDTSATSLPPDKAISKVLRAYRDRHGTRSKPIGIATALQHILKDLGVPSVAFGEFTFTTLLTCCRTPKEARRIFKLMNDQLHPISPYSWSILVDIHAKLGDFEGCAHVIKEMALEGVPPTQAAYTSLLAACYKVCNDGRIPHSIRAKAGKIGWEHWQEMRIVGVEADAMAFGAIIRLCAARGQAERAINLLEEMQRFDVKPTTLCFSSALRAVARSHEIGVRFERGASKKQLRRELFASHHGRMARDIVIMAENTEVEQDESFVSALMLCAAAASDSATAKAIYLASEVRKMDHLRTIGPNLRPSGDEEPYSYADLTNTSKKLDQEQEIVLLHDSTLDTPDRNRIDEKGTLSRPEAVNGSAPQAIQTKKGTIPSFGEREYGKDTRVLSALLRACGQALDGNGLGTIWAGRQNQGYLCENSLRLITTRWEPSYTKSSISSDVSTKVGVNALRRFDEDDRDEERKKGAARKKFRGLYLDDDAVATIDEYADIYNDRDDVGDEEAFLERHRTDDRHEPGQKAEDDAVQRATNSSIDLPNQSHSPEHDTLDDDSFDFDDSEAFEVFFEELKAEATRNGMDGDLSEDEARDFFAMMHEELLTSTGFLDENVHDDISETGSVASEKDISLDVNSIHDEDEPTALHRSSCGLVASDTTEKSTSDFALLLSSLADDSTKADQSTALSPSIGDTAISSHLGSQELADLGEVDLAKIADLEAALPGMPLSRLKRVLRAFNETLSYPSILSLVPILRETLPDRLSSGLLKKMNMRNAQFVYEKAEEEGQVNGSLLNAMLQVKTYTSALDDAEKFHGEAFQKHNMKPTAYSDRLVLQMLVGNNRLSRALNFKQRVETDKRILDIPSYGSFVEYYARHGQLGSALILLKECLTVHGAPPAEKYLSSVRVLCRQKEMDDELQLNHLIGEDPTEWLKYGERYLKRERSKKGRRDVDLAYNRILG